MKNRILTTLASIFLLTGCITVPPKTSEVRSSISEHHSLASTSRSDTFTVLPWRKELEDSLEYQTYANQAIQSLRSKGFNVVSAGNQAKYAIFLDYGIDTGRSEVVSYSIPQFGVTGYAGSRTTGTISSFGGISNINAQTNNTNPILGVTGYRQRTQTNHIFRRFINMDIVELNAGTPKPRKVYEGRLISEGACGNISSVMPELISSLFSRFPGESGRVRSETVLVTNTNSDC